MLHHDITNFLSYCQAAQFSHRSVEKLNRRLHEFNKFIQSQSIHAITDISYHQLAQFASDYKSPSVHVKKDRVWSLHKFFHYLQLNQIISQNIALQLPYPKIEKKVPTFLTIDEFNKILEYFAMKANSLIGFRNLILIMLLGFVGLRSSAIVAINIEDIDLADSLIWIHEKGCWGPQKRQLFLPQILCQLLYQYLQLLARKTGPLFLSQRNERLARRSLQSLFHKTAEQLGINKKLHPHLFRHTAATHLNKVAGVIITQYVLGHQCRQSTTTYTHLNPDIYAVHMKNHPYMQLEL